MVVGGEKMKPVTKGNCNKQTSYVLFSVTSSVPRWENVDFFSIDQISAL